MAEGTATPVSPAIPALRTVVKLALRITSTTYDDEIDDLLDAALDDLKLVGVSVVALAAADLDPLLKRAVVTYAKAHFGLDNPDAERYMLAYESLRTHLSLSSEYKQPKRTGITGSITAGTSLLTVSSATGFAADDWITVAGAGAGGALLIVRIDSISGSVFTIDGIAGTTVTSAAVTLA